MWREEKSEIILLLINCNNFFSPVALPIFLEEDVVIKEKKYETLAKTVKPKLEKLNEIIVKNKGHLATGKVLTIIAFNLYYTFVK